MFYSRTHKIGYTECDENNMLRLSAAMRQMQEASSEHLESLGIPATRLFLENMVFLLSKSCIRIHRMPVCAEEVRVSTAPVEIRGVRFIREFIVESLQGERLISALTLWVLADPRTHKVLRPAQFPYELPLQDSLVRGDIGDIPMPRLLPPAQQLNTSVAIRYSHLDVNRHVNNSMYGDFLCDALPYDELVRRGLDTVAIHFKNEARWGEIVEMTTSILGETEYHVSGTHSGGPCFEALAVLKTEKPDIRR